MRIEIESTEIEMIAEQLESRLEVRECTYDTFCIDVDVYGVKLQVSGDYSVSIEMASVRYNEEPYVNSISSRVDISEIKPSQEMIVEFIENTSIIYDKIVCQIEDKVCEIINIV